MMAGCSPGNTTFECDLPNVEAVAKEMSKRTPGKGDAANGFTGS